jgi:transporter family protein
MITLLVILVVIPGTVGDVLSCAGMKQHGEIKDWSPTGLLRVGNSILHNAYVMLSIPAMAVSFFALVGLLSLTDLSFAVPITSSSYILDAILAKYWLKEHMDWHRWFGISLVAFGVALLSL